MIGAMVPLSKLFRATLVAIAVLLSPPILSAQEDSCTITIDEDVQIGATDGSLYTVRITGTAEGCDSVLVSINCMGNPVTKLASAGSGTWQVEFDASELKRAECTCFGRIRIDADCAYGYFSCPDYLVTNIKCEEDKECDDGPGVRRVPEGRRGTECDKGVDLCCLLRGIVLGALLITIILSIISFLGHSWAKDAFKVSAYVTILLLILLIVFCCCI